MGNDAPNVVVDLILKEDLVFLVIKNHSPVFPALNVRFDFRPGILGLGGTKKIHSLQVFSNIPFLSPNREIEVFVDHLPAFLANFTGQFLDIQVMYQSEQNRNYRRFIRHNIHMLRDLPIVHKS